MPECAGFGSGVSRSKNRVNTGAMDERGCARTGLGALPRRVASKMAGLPGVPERNARWGGVLKLSFPAWLQRKPAAGQEFSARIYGSTT